MKNKIISLFLAVIMVMTPLFTTTANAGFWDSVVDFVEDIFIEEEETDNWEYDEEESYDYTDWESTPSSWAEEEVELAKDAGLITDSVMEDYQADITREQFCELVILAYEELSGEEAYTGNVYFEDTYNPEILKAANLGIVNGYGDGIFAPDDLITREQIATMLVRMLEVALDVNFLDYERTYFDDEEDISFWSWDFVQYAYYHNIMKGVGNNCIAPLENTTCEQAILLVYRTVNGDYEESKENDDYKYDVSETEDSFYELSPEHIAQDEETYLYYTDNIILAFIEDNLTRWEKEEIAKYIDGELIAQLVGTVNVLQIKIGVSSYDELNSLAELLMEHDKVYFATPDILMNKSSFNDIEIDGMGSYYAGKDEWWFEAIDADYVWDNYSDYIFGSTVGALECGGVVNQHGELSGKISFPTGYSYDNIKLIDEGDASHGTNVCGIIAANKDDKQGIVGIANTSRIVYAPMEYGYVSAKYKNYRTDNIYAIDYESALKIVAGLENVYDLGAKAINVSMGDICYGEDRFYELKDVEQEIGPYNTYDDYKNASWFHRMSEDEFYGNKVILAKPEFKAQDYKAYLIIREYRLISESRIIAAVTCQLIKEGDHEFLIIQGAGNGENNQFNVGVEAKLSGLWAYTFEGVAEQALEDYDISYQELKDHIMIVAAVDKKSDNDTNYTLVSGSNYGEKYVDICAPGKDIYTCNMYTEENGWYETADGTSMAAPMVTGTAAVLWGIDPSLTAGEVKELIIEGAKYKAIGVGDDAGTEYPMLNVRGSVEKLLENQQRQNGSGFIADFPFDGSIENVGSEIVVQGYGNYTYAKGVRNTGIYLDGDGDYLDLGNGYSLNDDFTFNVWVKAESEDRSDAALFAKYETNGYGPYDFYLAYNRPALWVSDGYGGHKTYFAETTLSRDKWYMLTYVKENNTLKIYINGKLELQDEVNITTNNDTVTIGRQAYMFEPHSDLEYKGYLDELKIYDRALSTREINDMYSAVGIINSEPVLESYNGHFYKVFLDAMTWEEAKEYCESQGGHLVTITSREENDFVINLAKKHDCFWIGATSPITGGFRWVTAEKPVFTEPLEYGEPGEYAIYISASPYGWTNVFDRELPFVCEWDDDTY